MVKSANEIFRDFETDGVPSSGPHQPIKADIRELLGAFEQGSNIPSFNSLADAQLADLSNSVKRLQVQFRAPVYTTPATLVGGFFARRESLANLTNYPSLSYFRTVDRYLPNGTTDATNGGYWVIDEDVANVLSFGAIPDCTGQGIGTDVVPAIKAAWDYAIARVGSGASIVLPSGRYRASTSAILDMKGLNYISLDMQGTITTDAVAMTCLTFRNGFDLCVRASALQGGIFLGWLEEDGVTFSPLPFGVDYAITEDVVSAGGQEFIKIQGVFGAEVQLQATNYAGRLLRTTERADSSHPRTAAIRGSVETGFDEKTDIARCAQSIYADAGTTEGPGNWGSLDRLINDFDTYGPVWRGLNDIELIAVDAAYGASGMIFKGCQAVHGLSWYVGDISSIANADHITFMNSDLGRQCAFINVSARSLNAGHGIYLENVLNSRVSMEYLAPSASLPMLYGVRANNCVNCHIDVSLYGYGTSLVAITGSSTEGVSITPKTVGSVLVADAVAIGSDVTGSISILDPYLVNVPATFSLIKVQGTAIVNVIGGFLKTNNGYVFDAQVSSNNLFVTGTPITLSGSGALNKSYSPRSLTRYSGSAEAYSLGTLRSNSGGNSTGSGGAISFGLAAGDYTNFSGMAQVKAKLTNATGTELQGGISLQYRPTGSSGQTLADGFEISHTTTDNETVGVLLTRISGAMVAKRVKVTAAAAVSGVSGRVLYVDA